MTSLLGQAFTVCGLGMVYAAGVSTALDAFDAPPLESAVLRGVAMMWLIAFQLYEGSSWRRKWGPR